MREEKIVLGRADSWGSRPQDPHAALVQARDLLAEEGKWCTGAMFQDGDERVVFENGSLCGDWQVCAMGAIAVVTGEMPIKAVKIGYNEDPDADDYADFSFEFVDPSSQSDSLTYKAGQVLAIAIAEEAERADGKDKNGNDPVTDPQAVVFNFNDNQANRADVLDAFDKAIKLSRKRFILNRIFGGK